MTGPVPPGALGLVALGLVALSPQPSGAQLLRNSMQRPKMRPAATKPQVRVTTEVATMPQARTRRRYRRPTTRSAASVALTIARPERVATSASTRPTAALPLQP